MSKYLRIYKDIDGTTIYRYHFPSLLELVNYLRTTEVRHDIFPIIHSERIDKPDKPFFGEPLDATLDHLIYGYNQSYAEYREQSQIGKIEIEQEIDYSRVRPVRSRSGSRVDVNAYLNGSDKCMLRAVRSVPKQFRTINYDLAYKAATKKEVIVNRGMICMLLIKALEQNNISVNLNCFNLLYQVIDKETGKTEMIYTTINLKDVDRTLNESMCIGPFNRPEFVRRVIFRLIETTPVNKAWQVEYGHVLKDSAKLKRIIGAGEDDITFENPENMGIKGEDIYDDFESVVKYLKLEDVVKLRKILK